LSIEQKTNQINTTIEYPSDPLADTASATY